VIKIIKISFITNGRTPYRKLQFEEFSKIPDTKFNIYYTNPNVLERKWKVPPIKNVTERALKGIKFSERIGYLNFGLKRIVLDSDVVLIGGTIEPTYQLIARLCRKYQKKYVLVFDGVSPKKVEMINRNSFIYKLKKDIIKDSAVIFGNGAIAIKYFSEVFGYPKDRIFNQYLTVDIETIKDFRKYKNELKKQIISKYNIPLNKNVVIYSGRLIKRKNVDLIIKSMEGLKNVFLLIVGDGEENEKLSKLASKLKIDFKITGFIEDQEELFKLYYAGDLLILPSYNEPWGLVVNEAMAAGLPVIVSNESGCSLDLVKDGENGFILSDLENPEILRNLIIKTLENKENFSKKSLEIIDNWTFENSRESFESLLKAISK